MSLGPSHAPVLRLVLLDVDETLFDHRRARRAAVRAVLSELGAPRRLLAPADREYQRLLDEVHPEVLRGAISRPRGRQIRFGRLAAWAGRPRTDDQATDLAAIAAAAYRSHRYPVLGAAPFVRELHRRWPVAAVSNNFEDEQDEKLRAIGLRPWVDALVTSGSLGWVKPDPRIFRHAVDLFRVRPEEAIMIGDSWASDVLGARAAGVPALWLDRREPGRGLPGGFPRIRSLRPVEAAVRRVVAVHRRQSRSGHLGRPG